VEFPGRDEGAIHGTLSNRGNGRARRFTQHVKETVSQHGGLVEETTGQLDRILAHWLAFVARRRNDAARLVPSTGVSAPRVRVSLRSQ
jgi:hypothetical protein